jgi:hypothetical protein
MSHLHLSSEYDIRSFQIPGPHLRASADIHAKVLHRIESLGMIHPVLLPPEYCTSYAAAIHKRPAKTSGDGTRQLQHIEPRQP